MFTVTASTFKRIVESVAHQMSQQSSLTDKDLANYNLLFEISELYETVEILIQNKINSPLPALSRLVFERYIYIKFLNEDHQYVDDRAKRYLDQTEYDVQKYHEFIYKEDSEDVSHSSIRNYLDINISDINFSKEFNNSNLIQTENNYRSNFTNIENTKTKSLTWYLQTDKYKTTPEGNNEPIKLNNFKDLCYYLGFPVYYHICYKNFSSNIHGSASLRSTIRNSLDKLYNENSYIDLSINIIAYCINRLYAMF